MMLWRVLVVVRKSFVGVENWLAFLPKQYCGYEK
jgi:hypothetical protein